VSGDLDMQDDQRKFFSTIMMCMAYICDKLMFELIVADGQNPTIIEKWNVRPEI